MKTSRKTKNDKKVIRIMSFGFKHGALPSDAAFFLDCRGLTNPHYQEKLRPLTGASRAVADFLRADAEVQALLASLPQLLVALLPGLITRSAYHKEVKLCFGCTGGKHRSRFFAITAGQIIRALLEQHPQWDCRVVISHRDAGCE